MTYRIIPALFWAVITGLIVLVPVQAGRDQTPVTSGATPVSGTGFMREAMFYEELECGRLQCQVCFRECVIAEGSRGFCGNKEHIDGKLYSVVYGKPSAVHIDPMEKEPQFHNLPGTDILCIGTAGCNFTCRHCHNWHLSQSTLEQLKFIELPPQAVIAMAKEHSLRTISFTYNEPTSCYEYLYDIARMAKEVDIKILWHSNGAMNPEPLKELLKYTNAVTIDLKGFSQRAYDNSSARLEPVLKALEIIRESGVWLEIVNLVIPTINDDPAEIRKMCAWIADTLGTDVPLHFTRFVPAYRLTHLPPTPVETLETAYCIAKEEGIEYVFIGNVPGHTYNSTFCANCDKRIIHRVHFQVIQNLIEDGACGFCGHEIPGLWF